MDTFTTKIDKRLLLAKIRDNREKHVKQYADAYIKFLDQYVARLSDLIGSAKTSGKPELYINLRTPECHTEDYDSVISMLEMSSETEISMNHADFECFVLDKWPWAHSFFDNTTRYLR
jgi:hypothetical protein